MTRAHGRTTGWIAATLACALSVPAHAQYATSVVSGTGVAANAPSGSVPVAAPNKVVGGGARANWTGNGSLLTSTQPIPGGWAGAAKDHQVADPSTLTVFAVQMADPTDDYEVYVGQAASTLASHPTATAVLPPGYVLAGGGCTDNWATGPGVAGNLLTASFPASTTAWECDGKDHAVASPATLTAYVIGLRPKRAGVPVPTLQITRSLSAVGSHPSAVATTPPGYVLTGGGARALPADPAGWGQLLTASYPEVSPGSASPVGWHAISKDHLVASPGTVEAFAVNLSFGASPGGGGAAAGAAVQAYLNSLPQLIITTNPSRVSTPTSANVYGGKLTLEAQAVTDLKIASELVLTSNNAATNWPGAIINGATLGNGTFGTYPVLPRSGGILQVVTNSLIVGNPQAPSSVTLADTRADLVQTATDQLLAGLAPTGSTGAFSMDFKMARSVESALVKAGAAVSYGPVKADASLEDTQNATHSAALVKITQVFYSVMWSPVAGSNPFFQPSVGVADLQAVGMSGNAPPVYVSQVDYGRSLLFMITSNGKESDLQAAVSATVNSGGFSGKANLSVDQKASLQNASVSIVTVGSTGAQIGTLLQPQPGEKDVFDSIRNYFAAGQNFSLANKGAPVSMKMVYLGSGTGGHAPGEPVKVPLLIQYRDVVSPGGVKPSVCQRGIPVFDGPGGGPVRTAFSVGGQFGPLQAGDTLTINASGTNWSGVALSGDYGPDGWVTYAGPSGPGAQQFPIWNRHPFALVARVGGTGQSIGYAAVDPNGNTSPLSEWFYVGKGLTATAGAIADLGKSQNGTGDLWLGTNDDNPYNGDPNKKFLVDVCVTPAFPGLGQTSPTN